MVVPSIHDVVGAPVPGTSGVASRPLTAPQTRFHDVLRRFVPAPIAPARRVTPTTRPTAPTAAPQPQRRSEASKAALRAAIGRASTSVGVDPALSVGVARAESSLDPTARSSDGLSVGTFQMTRTTAGEMRRRIAAHVVARPTGPEDVALGVGYIRYLQDLFGRDARLGRGLSTVAVPNAGERRLFAIAAFNAGEGRVAEAQARARGAGGDPTRFADIRRFLPPITQTYVTRVAGYSRDSAAA